MFRPWANFHCMDSKGLTQIKDSWKNALAPVIDPSRVEKACLIAGGGSSRSFYRLEAGGRRFILQETSNMEELAQYSEMAKFYRKHKVSVPRVLSLPPGEGVAVLSDGGDADLQGVAFPLLHSGKTEDVKKIYRKAIDQLLKIQQIPAGDAPAFVQTRIFDFSHYRWETDYFLEKCAGNFFKMGAIGDPMLTVEMDGLARSLEAEPLFVVHRDFQSRNILIHRGRVQVIDFQSARLGSIYYDLASLLKDPYVELPPGVQEDLFRRHYTGAMDMGLRPGLSYNDARRIYLRAAAQRLMQALGAYGKLGLDDGKNHFLQFIPPALRLLKGTLDELADYHRLRRLVDQILPRADALPRQG